jgi:hypothetical protein
MFYSYHVKLEICGLIESGIESFDCDLDPLLQNNVHTNDILCQSNRNGDDPISEEFHVLFKIFL